MPADSEEHPSLPLLRQQRGDLVTRLKQEGAYDLASPLQACGEPFYLTCTCCGENKETTTSCRKRWCPVCAPVLSAVRHSKWKHAINSLQWPLFVTFTIPNSEDPESLTDLKKHWGKFRRRKLWKDTVKGGVGTFEITNKGDGWHPHIHAVIDCEWLAIHVPAPLRWESKAVKKQKCELAQKELSRAWAEQIGSTHGIVWARRVYGSGVVSEILKYAVKGSELLDCSDPIAPMIRVLRKTRTLSGFGSLFPLPSPDEEEPFAVACENCGAEKSFLPDEVIQYFHSNLPPSPHPTALLNRNYK